VILTDNLTFDGCYLLKSLSPKFYHYQIFLIKTQSDRKTIMLILCFDKLGTSNQENQGSAKIKSNITL